MKRVLIFDMLNQFLRNWHVNPTISKDGTPIGGVAGTLKTMQKLMREIDPTVVIAAWDGSGGSSRRRKMNKEYKAGRKPTYSKANFNSPMSDEELQQNRINQQIRLAEYINHMPIIQLMYDNVEADDVIAYVVKHEAFEDYQKVIVSADKDFIQLVTGGKVVLFRPIQNEIINTKEALAKFSIHPRNFAIARAIVGDKSDNIDGIRGAGLATIAKRYPFLAESKEYTVQDLLKATEEYQKDNPKLKLFQKILDNKTLIQENYRIMQLETPLMSSEQLRKIDNIVGNFEPELEGTDLQQMMGADGLSFMAYSELWNKLKTFRNI